MGDAEGLKNVGIMALNDKKFNIAFQCFFSISINTVSTTRKTTLWKNIYKNIKYTRT